MHMDMTFEEFQRLLMEDRKSICERIDAYVVQAERYGGDKNTSTWRNYEMNLSLQRAFCNELNRAASLPTLAPEVLGTRYRLWNEFVRSVKELGSENAEPIMQTPAPISAPALTPEPQVETPQMIHEEQSAEPVPSESEEEHDLTIYKDKHPAPPREDDLAVVSEKKNVLSANPLPPRIKPKPTFHPPVEKKESIPQPMSTVKNITPTPIPQPAPQAPKPVRLADMKRVAPVRKMSAPQTPPVAPKRPMPKLAPKPVSKPAPQTPQPAPEKPVDITLTEEGLEVRKGIIEKVAKTAKGFLDNIFGAIGDNDAGLSHIKDLTLSDIIGVEKLPPDAHAARLAELNVNQKEWGSWIDWVNESNRLVPANVSSTLGQYLDKVSDVISKK